MVSDLVGCIYCKKIFPANQVKRFLIEKDGRLTGSCPYCDIDSLLPSACVDLSLNLLEEMNKEFF